MGVAKCHGENLSRLEVKMRQSVRDDLEALAAELGTSPSELVRMGVRWVLNRRSVLLTGEFS